MKKITINDVLNITDGIGVSKSEYRNATGLTSENNRNYSDKVHSYGSKGNISNFVNDLCSFAKENGFQNSAIRVDKLTPETFKTYLQDKINFGGRDGKGITQKVVSNIVSEAQKLSIAIEKLESEKNHRASKFANKEQLIAIKEELRPFAKKAVHKNRALNNGIAEKIINSIKNEKAQIGATLQLKAGLRESEAIKIKSWQVGDKIDIQGKGGYHRTALIGKEMYEKIASYVTNTGSFSISRYSYEKALKFAFAENNVKYEGTHSLRYTYAQNSFIDKVNSGIESKEALRQVSEEMGHHRPDITLTYLK